MLARSEAIERIVRRVDTDSCLISGLGYLSRDLHRATGALRERCLYCLGSMGSVVPVALGIALSRPLRVLALEGDGSLLMNLGSLVTLRRYGSGRISLFVFDNRCYESTGAQPSQPEGFEIADVCRAAGLATAIASEAAHIDAFLERTGESSSAPGVLVIKTRLEPPSPRVDEHPGRIAERFSAWLQSPNPAQAREPAALRGD